MAKEAPQVEPDPIVMQEYGQFRRPIPGQSLTNDPENPGPYEKPPKFTNLTQAQMFIFQGLTKEEVYVPFMSLLDTGEASIMELTQNILFGGFRSGHWNPDMMLLLAEPTAYMIMALAERADIEFRIDDDPDEDEEDATRMESVLRQKTPESKNIPAGAIPKEIEAKLDEAPVEALEEQSLLAEAPEEAPLPPEEDSLLGA